MKSQTKKRLLTYILTGAMVGFMLPAADAANQKATDTVKASNTADSRYELITVNKLYPSTTNVYGVYAANGQLNLYMANPPAGSLHNINVNYKVTDSTLTTVTSVYGLYSANGAADHIQIDGAIIANVAATGAAVTSTTVDSGNGSVDAIGMSGRIVMDNLLRLDVTATGGNVLFEGALTGTDVEAKSVTNAIGLDLAYVNVSLANTSYIKATATSGTVNAELEATAAPNNMKLTADASATAIGANLNTRAGFSAADGLNITVVAKGGAANAEIEIETPDPANPPAGNPTVVTAKATSDATATGLAVESTNDITIGNGAQINVTATAGAAGATYESEIVGPVVWGDTEVQATAIATGVQMDGTGKLTFGNNTNIVVAATAGTVEVTDIDSHDSSSANSTASGIDASDGTVDMGTGTNISATATGGSFTLALMAGTVNAATEAYGVKSDGGVINLNGNTTIVAKAVAATINIAAVGAAPAKTRSLYTHAYALYANGATAAVNVNQSAAAKGAVNIQGDIVAANNGQIKVNLDGKTSVFNGTVLQTNDPVRSGLGRAPIADAGKVYLSLDNGAKWQMANNSQLTDNSQLASVAPKAPNYANTLQSLPGENRGQINVYSLNVGKGSLMHFAIDDMTRGSNLTVARDDQTNPLWRVIQSDANGAADGGFNVNGSGNTVVMAANLAGDINKAVGETKKFGDMIDVDKLASDAQKAPNYIAINDYTASNSLKGEMLVIKYDAADANTNAKSFVGRGMNIGAINATPILNLIENDPAKNKGWYLTGYKVRPSDTVVGASSMANASYGMLKNMNNNLDKRMGDLHNGTEEAGVWMRIYGGETNITGNTNMKTKNIQGGFDKVKKVADGKKVTGVTVEYSEANNTFSVGHGETGNARVGLYYAWLGDSGSYYDVTLKTGLMTNEMTVYGDELTPGNVDANYRSWNTSVSAEYGKKITMKNGVYYTPQVELAYGRINGANYMATNGVYLQSSAINSLLGRIGIKLGKEVQNKGDIYLAANLYHEFLAKTAINGSKLTTASRLETDLKGTSFELALGGNLKLSKISNLYGEVSKSFGGKVKNDWQLQIGARFGF